MKRWRVLAAVAGALSTGVAEAQRSEMSVEVGAASTRYADSISMTSLSLSPAISLLHRRASLNAFGSLSGASGATTSSGSVDAVLRGPSLGFASVEIEGVAGGSAHGDGARTGQMLAAGRVRAERSTAGAWGGAGLGRTWDGGWRAIAQAEVGVWLSLPIATASVGVTPTVVDDSIEYTDVSLTLDGAGAAVEWNASVGVRGGHQIPAFAGSGRTWGSVGMAWRWRPEVALVASAGTYPIDLAQGFPGGKYFSLGLRYARVRSVPALSAPARVGAQPSGVRSFRVSRVAGDTYELRVRAPSASSVEVSGDATQWQTVPLMRGTDGVWTVRLRMVAGAHEIAIRTNRGRWTVPPGLTPLTDEFGGVSGLLSVPR